MPLSTGGMMPGPPTSSTGDSINIRDPFSDDPSGAHSPYGSRGGMPPFSGPPSGPNQGNSALSVNDSFPGYRSRLSARTKTGSSLDSFSFRALWSTQSRPWFWTRRRFFWARRPAHIKRSVSKWKRTKYGLGGISKRCVFPNYGTQLPRSGTIFSARVRNYSFSALFKQICTSAQTYLF